MDIKIANMKKKLFNLLMTLLLGITFQVVNAQVSGTVFRDYNGNGTQESAEPSVAGIKVSAYDASGALCGTATSTGAAGTNYSLSGCTGPVRIEFEIPNNGCEADKKVDYSAMGGGAYGTSVQFVTSPATGVNYAIHDPNEYGGHEGINPDIYNIILRAGNPTPTPPAPP